MGIWTLIQECNLEQLKIANDLKMHEDLLIWTIFSIFFAVNALLMGGYFQSKRVSNVILIPLFGIVTCGVWWIVQYRLLTYYELYDRLVKRLEELIPNIRFRAISGNFYTSTSGIQSDTIDDCENSQDFVDLRLNSNYKRLLQLVPIGIGIFWLFVIILN